VINQKLYGKILKNIQIYREAQEIGFDYVVNPVSGELHCVSLDEFWGSHKIQYSNLEDFIGIVNWGVLPIHNLRDGTEVPIFDINTGDLIGTFILNKCGHCFPD
jgi:hypothetical protein